MKLKFLLIAILAVFICGCDKKDNNSDHQTKEVATNSAIKQQAQEPKARDMNASFKLTMLNGTTLTMQKENDGFKMDNKDDKVTLLVFFATWCPPCKAEIPHLINLQNKFKSKLRIIGVLMENKDKATVRQFVDKHKINYDVAIGTENFWLAKLIGNIAGIPYMVLYYPNGKYATNYLGLVPEEMLQSDITKVMF